LKITVLGAGYVGLISGVCLAAKGHDVLCIESRPEFVEQLNRGEPHIYEKDLPSLLRQAVADGRFRATADPDLGFDWSELVIVAVGTPSVEGKIDLGQVGNASSQIGRWLKAHRRFTSVVIKSTVVPGTTDGFVRSILQQSSGLAPGQFGLGMNPEFLREGNAVEDFMNADRIVLGHEDSRTLALLRDVYAPWACDKLEVNSRTAEMIKYASNCLLAAQISAVNELANLCFQVGNIDAQQVMNGVHLDRRWNPIASSGQRVNPQILSYLLPGCGFGGSCFPKDVQALRTFGKEHGTRMAMLDAILDVNERQPHQVTRMLESHLRPIEGKTVLLLGLAFKPGTDDVRESASLGIARELDRLKCRVIAHDPVAADNARKELADTAVSYVQDWKGAIEGAEAVIVATKWPEYAALKEASLASALIGKFVADPRRMFDPDDFQQYLTIGRRIPSPSS